METFEKGLKVMKPNKKSKFDEYVDSILKNEDGWNKRVKEREYQLDKKDSYSAKIIKIYKYANKYGS